MNLALEQDPAQADLAPQGDELDLPREALPPQDGAAAASPHNEPAALQTDTLADSIVVLLIMTVLQRTIGFGRGMLFCRWLDSEQLGLWDVAFGFINLAAPLAVLGLPGSFGRYVEYYRQRGQLAPFCGARPCSVE